MDRADWVCMSGNRGGDYVNQVGHAAGSSGKTQCGAVIGGSNWRHADSYDGITCGRCRKILGLDSVKSDPLWY
jgi:hypothetical protein